MRPTQEEIDKALEQARTEAVAFQVPPRTPLKRPNAPAAPRIVHPNEYAAIQSPTTTPPAPTGSGPLSEAESTPVPSGKGSGAQNAAGGVDPSADFGATVFARDRAQSQHFNEELIARAAGGAALPMSAVEREWRAVAASLTEERDFERVRCAALADECDRLQRERDAAVAERNGMEKRLNETERKMAASWDEQKAATQGLRERCASLEAERDASRRAEADADRTLEEVRATLLAERAQHEGFLRAFKFPADAHPLISALMERVVRVMCMEAAGGACNPHAVACAALDAAHSFAEQDGSGVTERLRDIVRVSAADVERWKEREKDAETYHAEWMHQRDLADALAEQIGHATAKRARKRARKAVAMAERLRVRLMGSLREEYDEEDPATDGERDDDDAF